MQFHLRQYHLRQYRLRQYRLRQCHIRTPPTQRAADASSCARQQPDEMNKRDGNGHTTQWRTRAIARFHDEPLLVSYDVAATPE